ncbi:hypothetical protein HZA97_09630 [Candidatus Woesearchaeota archaeon]|nr:hypothetical protein [Candidatus Woesearchaeota archaeon]
MKKLSIFVLMAVLLSISVFAVHESIPNVNWDNSQLNTLKNEDSYRCWSLTDSIKTYRNKEIDALLVAKACTQAVDHCELREERPVEPCITQCLSTGALSTEKQLINCMQICTQQYCTNELKLSTEKTITPVIKKEEPKPEIKIPEPAPVPEPKKEVVKEEPPKEVEVVEEKIKEEPKPKEVLTIQECNELAKKNKKENFCKEEITFATFVDDLNKATSENKDNSACTTAWNEYYKEEKKNCKTGIINYLQEKKLFIPSILILVALIIMLAAFFYYRHREKWHPIEWPKEEPKEEKIHLEIPEELKEESKPKEKEPVKNKRRQKPFTKHPEFYLRDDSKGIEPD